MSEVGVPAGYSLQSWTSRLLLAAAVALSLLDLPARASDGPAPGPGFSPVDLISSRDDPASEMIAEWFVRPMLKKREGQEVSFAWARLDIDGDGYDELVLKLLEPSLCPDRLSCPVLIFRRQGDGWEPILTAVSDSIWTHPDGSALALATRQGSVIHRWAWDPSKTALIPAR